MANTNTQSYTVANIRFTRKSIYKLTNPQVQKIAIALGCTEYAKESPYYDLKAHMISAIFSVLDAQNTPKTH